MSALVDTITAEIDAREAQITKLRGELDQLAAMKTTAEGLILAPALDADASSGVTKAPAPKGTTPEPASPRRAAGPTRERLAAGRPPNGAGGGAPKGVLSVKRQAPVDTLSKLGEASTSQVAAAAGRTGEERAVGQALLELRDLGAVHHNGLRAKAARWVALDRSEADQAVAEKPLLSTKSRTAGVLIQRINAAIAADPGLTEPQLAQALSLDREDVAVTCGTLLDREWVTRDPRGGYHPAAETPRRGGTA